MNLSLSHKIELPNYIESVTFDDIQLTTSSSEEKIDSDDVDDYLSPLTEISPDFNDDFWLKINENVDEYINYKKNRFIVPNKVIKSISTNSEKQTHLNENNDKYVFYKFYKLYDDNKEYQLISYAKKSIYDALSNDAKIFTKFNKDTKIYLTMLKIIRVKIEENEENLNNLLTLIKNNLEKENKMVLFQDLNFENCKLQTIETMLTKIKTMIEFFDIPVIKFYVYELYSESNPEKKFIIGSLVKITKNDAGNFINDECVEIEETNLKINLIKKIDAQLGTECLLNIDKQIILKNSVKNGYNKYYNIINTDNIEKVVFMKVQYELLRHIYKQVKTGSDWYIAMLTIGNKHYLYKSSKKHITDDLACLYEMTNHNESQFNSIIEILSVTYANDIKIELLKKNISKDEIDRRYISLLNTFKKEELLNYSD